MDNRRLLRRILFVVAISALISGVAAWGFGHIDVAKWIWAVGTIPIVTGLLASMVNAFLSGRVGVDSVAFVLMSAALALGESLAGIVVAIMYAGGNLLEDSAVSRAEKNLKFLVDRASRVAHVRKSSEIKDVPIGDVDVGDVIVVRGGEIIPVDGVIASAYATIDESALTGEPIPVVRQNGEIARSGTINVGETFEIQAKATAGESSYAGIVRLVTSAQTAKASFVRLADRYALLLLPALLLSQVARGTFPETP